MRESPRRRDIVPLLALVAIGALAAARWTSPVQWKPDNLFYQAHVYQVQGDSHAVAYRKVFAGPLSLPRREGDAGLPLAQRRVGNPEWVRYSERFYERRWFVPAVAALLSPFYGTDALRVTSLVAYVLLGPALYALLRLRARRTTAFLVAAGVLFLAPVLFIAGLPLMAIRALTIQGSYVGSPKELRELVGLAQQGRLAPLPVTTLPRSQVNEALTRLRDGKVTGRLTSRCQCSFCLTSSNNE